MVAEDIEIKFNDDDGKKRLERVKQGLKLNGLETTEIVGHSSHACIYTYKNEKWDKFGVEGALFICENVYKMNNNLQIDDNSDNDDNDDDDVGSHNTEEDTFQSLIILNRVAFNNFAFPLSSIKNFNIQDQFIMIKYNLDKNNDDEIFAIWMYDDGERKTIASLISNAFAKNKEYYQKNIKCNNKKIPQYYYYNYHTDESTSSSSSLSRFIRLPLDGEANKEKGDIKPTISDVLLRLQGDREEQDSEIDINSPILMSLNDITTISFR